MTQEAFVAIVNSSNWKGYGFPSRIRATFIESAGDENEVASYIIEQDWSFLIKHVKALYVNFARVSATRIFDGAASMTVGLHMSFVQSKEWVSKQSDKEENIKTWGSDSTYYYQ